MREFFALEQISRPHGYDVCGDDFILRTRNDPRAVAMLVCDTQAVQLRFQRATRRAHAASLLGEEIAELAEQPAGTLTRDDVG